MQFNLGSSETISRADICNMAAINGQRENLREHSVFSLANATAETPVPERSCVATVFLAVILGLIVIFTIIGNALVIASVAVNANLRATTYYFIANLAIADLLLGTAVLPFSATLEVLQYWAFGQIFCDVWAAVDVLCCTASILSLCVISIDRYIGVTRPLQHGRIMRHARTMYVIVFIWLLSLAISVAPLIGWKEDPNPDPRVCTVTTQPGYVLFSVAGSFYIPCFIILVVYFRIYRETVKYTRSVMSGARMAKIDEENVISLRIHTGRLVRRDKQKENFQLNANDALIEDFNSDNTSQNLQKSSRRNCRVTFCNRIAKFRREKKAAKTLGIVVGVFITCWLPFFVVLPLDSLCRGCSVPPLLFKLFFWLGYCNSAMNPIIYTCSSMEFRRAFLAILTCKRCYSRPRISLTDDRSRKRAPRISVRALRRHHQQFKEQELELALRDMSSSSSSTPEAVSKVVSGLKLSSISLPHIFISSGDIVCEDRPKSLAGLQNKDMKTNMCLTCTSKRFLKGLKTITSKQESSPQSFYDDPQIFHQQFQT